MPYTYGWQSKKYLFGAYRTGDVAAAVQSGTPSRLLALASFYQGQGDHVKIVARLGGVGELVLLDTSANINRLEQEIDLLTFNNLLPTTPTAETDWYLSFRVEITSNWFDPTPESVDWPFVANTDVELYLYWNNLSQSVEVRTDPVGTAETRNKVSVHDSSSLLSPLRNVQTVFYFADQTVRLRAATVISDNMGRVRTALPTGVYNIEFHGAGILPTEWVNGYVVGAGNNLSPWRGNSTSGIAQASEFGSIKTQFSTLYWPGYMVAEDFSPERLSYRNEAAETNNYGSNYAMQLFGRVFAGKSYVDFIGIALDPSPE